MTAGGHLCSVRHPTYRPIRPVGISASPPRTLPHRPDLEQSRKRIEEIRAERERLERQQSRLQGQLQDVTTELRNLERQRDITNRLVNEIERQINGLGSQLDQSSAELILAQDNLVERRAVLNRRLVDIYKRGPLYTWRVLLTAESFGDLLSRYKYLYLTSRQDRTILTDVVAALQPDRPAAHPASRGAVAARQPAGRAGIGDAPLRVARGRPRVAAPEHPPLDPGDHGADQHPGARRGAAERDPRRPGAPARQPLRAASPAARPPSPPRTSGGWTGRSRAGSSTASVATPCRAAASSAGTGSGSARRWARR